MSGFICVDIIIIHVPGAQLPSDRVSITEPWSNDTKMSAQSASGPWRNHFIPLFAVWFLRLLVSNKIIVVGCVKIKLKWKKNICVSYDRETGNSFNCTIQYPWYGKYYTYVIVFNMQVSRDIKMLQRFTTLYDYTIIVADQPLLTSWITNGHNFAWLLLQFVKPQLEWTK